MFHLSYSQKIRIQPFILIRIRIVNADPDRPKWKYRNFSVADLDKNKKKISSGMVFVVLCSVPDPEADPHVFGPPGSGSISQRYGSGSESGTGFSHKVLS
jgi:hypothetical protein